MFRLYSRNLYLSSTVMDISGSTIMVAEDSEDSLALMRTFLEMKGYRVLEARDGEEAVEIACSALPDLIIMDLNMPKLNGIAAVEKIRQCEPLSKVPILTNSCSGKFGMDFFLNVGKLGGGYLEYIPKPFDLNSLSELIETILLKTKKAT